MNPLDLCTFSFKSGHPIEVATLETLEQIHDMVMAV